MKPSQKKRSNLKVKIGRRIVRFREREKMSQIELAEEAGIAPSYLSGVENGRRNITVDQLEKIADALGMEVKELFPNV